MRAVFKSQSVRAERDCHLTEARGFRRRRQGNPSALAYRRPVGKTRPLTLFLPVPPIAQTQWTPGSKGAADIVHVGQPPVTEQSGEGWGGTRELPIG